MKKNSKPFGWQVLASKVVYGARPWLEVERQTVRLEDGRIVDDFHQIYFPDYAMVYAELPDGRVVMERHYKHGVRRVNLTFPCGSVQPREKPKTAAQRELLEETGYRAKGWKSLGSFVIQANYGCGHAHFFSANHAKAVVAPHSGDLEHIEVVLMTRRQIKAAMKSGEIATLDSAMLAALMGLA